MKRERAQEEVHEEGVSECMKGREHKKREGVSA